MNVARSVTKRLDDVYKGLEEYGGKTSPTLASAAYRAAVRLLVDRLAVLRNQARDTVLDKANLPEQMFWDILQTANGARTLSAVLTDASVNELVLAGSPTRHLRDVANSVLTEDLQELQTITKELEQGVKVREHGSK